MEVYEELQERVYWSENSQVYLILDDSDFIGNSLENNFDEEI